MCLKPKESSLQTSLSQFRSLGLGQQLNFIYMIVVVCIILKNYLDLLQISLYFINLVNPFPNIFTRKDRVSNSPEEAAWPCPSPIYTPSMAPHCPIVETLIRLTSPWMVWVWPALPSNPLPLPAPSSFQTELFIPPGKCHGLHCKSL